MFEILQYEGPHVVGTNFGKGLGGGAQHCVMPACFDPDMVWPDVPVGKATQIFNRHR
jgi:hypothetical protein